MGRLRKVLDAVRMDFVMSPAPVTQPVSPLVMAADRWRTVAGQRGLRPAVSRTPTPSPAGVQPELLNRLAVAARAASDEYVREYASRVVQEQMTPGYSPHHFRPNLAGALWDQVAKSDLVTLIETYQSSGGASDETMIAKGVDRDGHHVEMLELPDGFSLKDSMPEDLVIGNIHGRIYVVVAPVEDLSDKE